MEMLWFGRADLRKIVGIANECLLGEFMCNILGADIGFLSILHIM